MEHSLFFQFLLYIYLFSTISILKLNVEEIISYFMKDVSIFSADNYMSSGKGYFWFGSLHLSFVWIFPLASIHLLLLKRLFQVQFQLQIWPILCFLLLHRAEEQICHKQIILWRVRILKFRFPSECCQGPFHQTVFLFFFSKYEWSIWDWPSWTKNMEQP